MKEKWEAGTLICSLLADLKSSTTKRDLQWGRRIHERVVQSRNDFNIYIATALVNMYAKCGSIAEAHRVFETVQKPNVVCWNALLSGYVNNGKGHTALELFSKMKLRGFSPDSITYVAVLKACTSLASSGDHRYYLGLGKQIHSEIGQHLDHYVQTTLIDMYSNCKCMLDARQVFDSIQEPNVVSWTALLLGYAQNGEGHVALDMFSRMKSRGCVPDSVTYVAAFKACAAMALNGSKVNYLRHGKQLHLELGFHSSLKVQNTLVDMYAKCGSMADARCVFESIQNPDVVSWNALLLGYADSGEGHAVLELFSRMKKYGCIPDSITYVAVLKACTYLAVKNRDDSFLDRGRDIHKEIGNHLTDNVKNTLIDMYAKSRQMREARSLFESLQMPDVVPWTTLLLGYADNGEGHVALDLFWKMKLRGCYPDSLTYVAALKACTSLAMNGDRRAGLEYGKKIHLEIRADHLDHYVQGTLVDMYAKCGGMLDAQCVFDTIQKPGVVSWTSLISGYADNGEGDVALEMFFRMKACECIPDPIAYVAVFKACGLTGALSLGRKFHSEIHQFNAHLVTCLVDFYGKCGSIAEAREVFDSHSRERDVSTWNALLAGYASFGETDTVFNLFEAMQDEGFRPDAVTFVCMLLCCSHAGLVERAREYFEGMTVGFGVAPTVMHYTCMVDLLGRANQLNAAIALVARMVCNPDAVTWNTLLSACRKWKNVELGRMAFRSLVDINKNDSFAHVLMAQIYGSRGMWEEQGLVLEKRMKFVAFYD